MKEIIKELSGWLLYIVLIIALTWTVVTFVGQRTEVSGSSMETTLSDKDQLIVDKMTYRFRDPKRYDIVVFPYQYQDNTYYIKRIIGLPGETVQILSGMVYIDGMRLDEHYGDEIMENPGIAEEPLTLGEDEYFVLGDNRNNSSDSRASDVGLIHRKDLIGMGAVVLDGARIGKDCIIGAGSLVTKNTVIPDGSLVMGSPAKIKRNLTWEEKLGNLENSKEYVSVSAEMQKQGVL